MCACMDECSYGVTRVCGECVPTTSYMAGDGPAAMVIKIDERSEKNNQTTWQ